MSMKRSRLMVAGLILTSCLILGIAIIGLSMNTQNQAIVLPAEVALPGMQGQFESLTLNTDLPKSPSSIQVYSIKSIDMIQDGNGDVSMTIRKSIPSASKAPALAEKSLEKYGGLPKDAQLVDALPRYQYKYNLTTNSVEEKYPWQTQVRYIQILDGFPVIGATINLGLGENGEITSLVKAWPTYESRKEVKIISAEKAYEKLKVRDTTEKLQGNLPEGSKVTEVKLGYRLFDAWNSDAKDAYLKPVWIFSVTSPLDPEPFPIMVDATA
ncbi:MAG: two-component system regulatory protein YycI [Methanoregula sp.]